MDGMPKDDQDDATLFDPYFAWDEHTVPHEAESLDALIAAARHQLPPPQLGSIVPATPSRPAPSTRAARGFIIATVGAFGILLAGAAVAIHSSRRTIGTQPTLPSEFVLPPPAPSMVSKSLPSSPNSLAHHERPKSGPTILYAIPEAPGPTAASPSSADAASALSADVRVMPRRHKHHRQGPPITYDCQGVPILP